MVKLESLICHACRDGTKTNLFDDENCRAVSGTCGHSVCEVCVDSDPKMKCPICFRKEAFIGRNINYGALGFRKEYEKNVFDVIRKWYEILTSMKATLENSIAYGSSDYGKEIQFLGYSAKCSDCTNLKVCLTCKFSRPYIGMYFADYAVCDDCASKEYGNKDMDNILDYEGVKNPIQCHLCSKQTKAPKFHGPLLKREMDDPDSRFNFCSDCILEHHKGHDVYVKWPCDGMNQRDKILETAAGIMETLLRGKLEIEENNIKCRLRYKRMMLTSSELMKLAKDPAAHLEDVHNNFFQEGTFAKTLSSLEIQYEQIQQLKAECQCVSLWNQVVELNIFESKGRSPHFHSMADKAHLEQRIDVCPHDLKSSAPEKRSLMNLIDRGEKLTTPFQMEIRREVRRSRLRYVYYFPTNETEIQKINPECSKVAFLREWRKKMHEESKKWYLETGPGCLQYFKEDGTVEFKDLKTGEVFSLSWLPSPNPATLFDIETFLDNFKS
ncbi:hypothetical protein L5515_015544 [Caenorhabditis briggsae]|uniref:RING-type domain-containing protein n=1 Tax=Caenorhabditis briggsae TaxID=6238 RepID=A0AAE9EF32_CAEBR|nr:hypothetical protein L5515_015544 [Caenorhabditis briggsae]